MNHTEPARASEIRATANIQNSRMSDREIDHIYCRLRIRKRLKKDRGRRKKPDHTQPASIPNKEEAPALQKPYLTFYRIIT